MYSEKAKALRRCTATRKDGEPCRAWALWDHPGQICLSHSERQHRGAIGARRGFPDYVEKPEWLTNYTPCTCTAYAWPHRPGGGLCRWPDPPERYLNMPPGTHSWPRLRRDWPRWRWRKPRTVA